MSAFRLAGRTLGVLAMFCGAVRSQAAEELKVVDTARQPIAGVQVVLIDAATGKTFSSTTDQDGRMAMPVDGFGRCTLMCAHPRYGACLEEEFRPAKEFRIQMPRRPNVGSIIFPQGKGMFPGESGEFTFLMDKQDRIFVHLGPEWKLRNGDDELAQTRIKKALIVRTPRGNSVQLRVVGFVDQACLIEYRSGALLGAEIAGNGVRIRSQTGAPVADAKVYFINNANKTYLAGESDERGNVEMGPPQDAFVTVYCVHPKYRAYREPAHHPKEPLDVVLTFDGVAGSIVCADGTGEVPALEGRLNPILDEFGRFYLYARNIALNGGRQQPVPFRPGEPIVGTDAKGNRCKLRVLEILGRTALIEYAPEQGIVRWTPIVGQILGLNKVGERPARPFAGLARPQPLAHALSIV